MRLTQRVKIMLTVGILLLLIPVVAMQFSDDVIWNSMDFVIMGFMLLFLGILLEVILRKFPKFKQRLILVFILLLVFFLIWAELAVGIFGTPFAGS